MTLRPRSLYGRLALTLAVLFTAVALSMVAVTHHFSSLYQQEVTQKLSADLAGHIVLEKRLMQGGQVDGQALQETFHMLMVINPNIELYIVDPKGKVLAYSAPPGRVKRAQIELGPIRDFLSGHFSFPILGDDPRDPAGRKIFSVAPIMTPAGPQGYLYVILASESSTTIAQELRASYVLQESVWTIVLGMLAALAAGLAVMFAMTGRLRRLTAEVAAFGQEIHVGEEAAQSATEGDEIDRLRLCFQQMAGRIELQIRQLKYRDGLRREQVASISHDLRTSLTVLHGCLETLQMKAVTQSGEERQQFIDTALKHSQHLTRLVSDFFELAKLEYRDAAPRLERFLMSELAQDVVYKFRPIAHVRGIRLDCEIGRGSYQVEADIGMLERVLTNLIHNALKFTPAGGSVSVRLASDGGQVRVRVEDTGSGMDTNGLQGIAEDTLIDFSSHRSGPDSSGLGLAIVQRILLLHGVQLAVQSRVGCGSSFGFVLPLTASEQVSDSVIEM